MSDAPQSSLAPPTCVSPLAALETNETTQAKPDDIQYSSETASPLCNETAHDVRNESTTAVDHPVHTHANEGGDHSASEQTISECASTSAGTGIQPPRQPYTGDFISLSASLEPESSTAVSEPLPPQPPQPSPTKLDPVIPKPTSTSSDPPQPTSDPPQPTSDPSTGSDTLHSHIPSVGSDPLPPQTTPADSNPTPPQLTSTGAPPQSSATGSVSPPHHLPPNPVTSCHPIPSQKKRRSTHKSKKASSLGVIGSSNVSRGINPSLSGQSQMSSDQVQNEIQAIDSILKALSTDGYSMSSMGKLSELTVEGDISSQMVTTKVSGNAKGVKKHSPLQSMNSVSSVQSYDSRMDSTSSDSGSSTDSSDESMHIGVTGCGKKVEEEEEGEIRREDPLPKTKGETSYKDLPPVERCDITFPTNGGLLPVASVSHYTEKLLVLASIPDTPPVDEGTVLWTKDKTSIAKVFETFGPVKRPFYSIRINSVDDMPSVGVALGDTVYITPDDPSLTKYVFPQELLKQKGSDASWKDDNEVPAQFRDYSDDESEHNAKTKSRDRKRGLPVSSKRAGQPSVPPPESGGMSSGLGRQPSVKYTKDPQMQHYFPRAADLHQQPPFRPPNYPPPLFPPHMPPFVQPPHTGMYPSPPPSRMTGVPHHSNPAFQPPRLRPGEMPPLRPFMPYYYPPAPPP